MSRKFTIIDYPQEGNSWGEFRGETPLAAAHHAFRELADAMGFIDSQDGQKYIVFTIRENGGHKRNYIGTWVNLHKPIPIEGTSEFVRRRPVVTNWLKGFEETFQVENKGRKN